MTCATCGRPFEPRRRAAALLLGALRGFSRQRQRRRQERDDELKTLAMAAQQAIDALARRLAEPVIQRCTN